MLIEGHTDSVGQNDSNSRLSQERANKVISLFSEDFGIDEGRMLALGLGEDYPIADNQTPLGRAKNRRVSIFIYDDKPGQ
jgi:OOP family OmpA-OmpF porin